MRGWVWCLGHLLCALPPTGILMCADTFVGVVLGSFLCAPPLAGILMCAMCADTSSFFFVFGSVVTVLLVG